MNYLVTRHSALCEFALLLKIDIDVHITHLNDVDMITQNDCVYGNLPIELVAKICTKGAKYFNFNLSIPFSLRGKELTLTDLQTYGGYFEQYAVKAISTSTP